MTGTIDCKPEGSVPSEFLAHMETIGVQGSLEDIFQDDPSSVQFELLVFFKAMLDCRGMGMVDLGNNW